MSESNMKKEVPIWEKSNLTLEEAAKYTGIGVNKLREISDAKDCKFVLWVGNKRLLKRRNSKNSWISSIPCREENHYGRKEASDIKV